MPEGDTLYKVAMTLREPLQGQTLTGWESPLPALTDAEMVGATVEQVFSRGKHLLIVFSNGMTVHSHLRMTGSWHVYGHGQRWRKPYRYRRLVLTTARHIIVCFSAPVCELLTDAQVRRHPHLSSLGPDLLEPTFEPTSAVTRLHQAGARPVAEAIMDQRLLAGIGNVYKSELLWRAELSPFTPVAEIPEATLEAFLTDARLWMRRNLFAGRRVMRWGPAQKRTFVYNQSGMPCPRCGTPIVRVVQADRSTYYCPDCQS